MSEARQILDADLKEKAWQGCVMSALRSTGWLAYHTWNSKHSTPGFPDIIAIRGWRILGIELKTETGTVTPAQQEWLTAFDATGHAESYLFRPSDWDTVERVIR